MTPKWNLQSPPTALTFGMLAGLLAAFSFLPTAIPLAWAIVSGEEAVTMRRVEYAIRSASVLQEAGRDLNDSFHQDVEVDLIYLSDSERLLGTRFASEVDLALLTADCSAQASVVSLQSSGWVVACSDHLVAAKRMEPIGQVRLVLGIVAALAIIVGLLTALGVLRLLRPLSEVSRALARVGSGERGVRMPQTGLAELDVLVDRLNAAARDMEDRQDTILGRIAVVQEMARMVAHEVRNPLQSIELLTSLIASEQDERERLELANAIHEEIRTLETVVTRLLRESATKGALRLRHQSASVVSLIEQVVALRRPQAQAQGVKLVLDTHTHREVPMDLALIKRSIENLVINAMQAVPPSGGIVQISVSEDYPMLLLAVDDNGPGVDPSLADQIFEADVTSKSRGTGLGLALVKGAIEAHDGAIQCVTSPMGGARFEVRIPLGLESDRE